MTPHQSFCDLSAIAVAYGAGKVSILIAQTIPSPDWIDKVTGPLGALVTMAIGIWYLSQRNAKQDAKIEERQKITDAKIEERQRHADEKEEVVTQARIDMIEKLTQTISETRAVVAQNTQVIERNSRALDRHPCQK